MHKSLIDYFPCPSRPVQKYQVQGQCITAFFQARLVHSVVYRLGGSKRKKAAVFGVYGSRLLARLSDSLVTLTIIFQAEMRTILECTCLGIAKGFRASQITILSDSQEAIRVLNSHAMTSGLEFQCPMLPNSMCTCSPHHHDFGMDTITYARKLQLQLFYGHNQLVAWIGRISKTFYTSEPERCI